MSYFPCDIPYMNKEELEENGIKIPKDKTKKKQEQPEVIRCNECAFCRSFLSDKVCSLGLLHNINSDMDFCSRAVRRNNES